MLKAIVVGLAALCLLAAPSFAKEQKMKAAADGQVEFSTPSGNIGCIYTPEGGTDIYQPVDGAGAFFIGPARNSRHRQPRPLTIDGFGLNINPPG